MWKHSYNFYVLSLSEFHPYTRSPKPVLFYKRDDFIYRSNSLLSRFPEKNFSRYFNKFCLEKAQFPETLLNWLSEFWNYCLADRDAKPFKYLRFGCKVKAVPLHAMEALGGRGYIAPTHSRPRHLDGGESSASRPCRALPPGKGPPPVPVVQEAGWAPEPVWTQRLEEKSFETAGDRTPIAQSSSP
jgi:hypothetical protein